MTQTKPSPKHAKKTEAPNLLAPFGCDNPYDFIENFLSNFELEEMDALLYKFLRNAGFLPPATSSISTAGAAIRSFFSTRKCAS